MKKGKLPLIAVDVCIFRRNEVLLGRRKGRTSASGLWNFPGGHLEAGETLIEAAKREIKEEIGESIKIEVTSKVRAIVENILPPDNIPHLVVVLEGKYISGEPELKEPDKCYGWQWFNVLSLPDNTFVEVRQALEDTCCLHKNTE